MWRSTAVFDSVFDQWTDDRGVLRCRAVNEWSVQRVVGAIAAALVILGAFLPWASISGFVSGSITGTTKGASDGWFTAAFAVVALVAFFVNNRGLYIAATVLSVLGIAIAVYDIGNISRLTYDVGVNGVEVSVGVGLWLTLVGIVISGVLAIVCSTQVRKTPAAQQWGYANYPQTGYPNYPQASHTNNPQAGYPNYPQPGTVPPAAPPSAPSAGGPNQPPPPSYGG